MTTPQIDARADDASRRSARIAVRLAGRGLRCTAFREAIGLCTTWAVLVCAVAGASAQPTVLADADRMRAKLASISEIGARPRDDNPSPAQTPFSESEVNAYLHVYGPAFLPDGLNDPQLELGDAGLVFARGVVDVDAVRLSRPRDWLDPLSYMTGQFEFTATGKFTSANGKGMASVESATLAGIPVPRSVVLELVRYYSTTPEWPNGFELDEPVDLPANILEVLVESGRATVIQ